MPPLAALSGKGKGLPAFRKAVREMVAHELHLRNKLSGKTKGGSGEGRVFGDGIIYNDHGSLTKLFSVTTCEVED